jgi:hypothetical protein
MTAKKQIKGQSSTDTENSVYSEYSGNCMMKENGSSGLFKEGTNDGKIHKRRYFQNGGRGRC